MLRPIIKQNLSPFTLTWIGDDAVDIEKTDIKQYLKTGDGLVLKSNCKPSKIICRELTQEDICLVSDMMGLTRGIKQVYDTTFLYILARLAIQEIEGIPLDFETRCGKKMLTEAAAEALSTFQEQVKLGNFCTSCQKEVAVTEQNLCQECSGETRPLEISLNFMLWLGRVLDGRFFRRRNAQRDS